MSTCFFVFKQKTAYEMRISDWSSDVCSSDLLAFVAGCGKQQAADATLRKHEHIERAGAAHALRMHLRQNPFSPTVRTGVGEHAEHAFVGGRAVSIGRASCRERGGQYV